MRLTATLVALGLGACGADDATDAPPYDSVPRSCPPVEEMAPTVLAGLRAGRLSGIRQVLGEEISDFHLHKLLDVGLRVIRGLSADELTTLLDVAGSEKVRALAPPLVALLRRVEGDPTDPSTFRSGLFAKIRRLLRSCRGAPVFEALDALIRADETRRLLSTLGESLMLPEVQTLFEPSSSGRPIVTREGFEALVCLMLRRFTEPGFDVSTDIVAPIRAVGALPTEEPPLSTLFADLSTLLTSDGAVFPPLQDLICCDLFDEPTCADVQAETPLYDEPPELTRLFYDALVSDPAQAQALLGQVSALMDDPAVSAALEPVGAVLRQLSTDADLRGALVDLFDVLLSDANARRVLPELRFLLESGSLDELLAVIESIAVGCEPEAVSP